MPQYTPYGQDTDHIRGTDEKSVFHAQGILIFKLATPTLMAELSYALSKWEFCIACFANDSREESYSNTCTTILDASEVETATSY